MDPQKVAGHSTGLPDGVTRQEVEQQLQRIFRSPVFRRSERLTRFLSYSVQEGLNGGADKVHEYTIALEVFDKSTDFDSRIDPVVRVEAGRLRAKIREYYATSGIHDGLFVGIRDRGYLPLVQRPSPHLGRSIRREDGP
jgi:adenylate cyclase